MFLMSNVDSVSGQSIQRTFFKLSLAARYEPSAIDSHMLSTYGYQCDSETNGRGITTTYSIYCRRRGSGIDNGLEYGGRPWTGVEFLLNDSKEFSSIRFYRCFTSRWDAIAFMDELIKALETKYNKGIKHEGEAATSWSDSETFLSVDLIYEQARNDKYFFYVNLSYWDRKLLKIMNERENMVIQGEL